LIAAGIIVCVVPRSLTTDLAVVAGAVAVSPHLELSHHRTPPAPPQPRVRPVHRPPASRVELRGLAAVPTTTNAVPTTTNAVPTTTNAVPTTTTAAQVRALLAAAGVDVAAVRDVVGDAQGLWHVLFGGDEAAAAACVAKLHAAQGAVSAKSKSYEQLLVFVLNFMY
jgi:hypothetical protein